MRCVTSPVLIWLGCTLCTCKVCLLLLLRRRRRCQCSTRASVRTTGAVSSKHSAVSSRIDRQTDRATRRCSRPRRSRRSWARRRTGKPSVGRPPWPECLVDNSTWGKEKSGFRLTFTPFSPKVMLECKKQLQSIHF